MKRTCKLLATFAVLFFGLTSAAGKKHQEVKEPYVGLYFDILATSGIAQPMYKLGGINDEQRSLIERCIQSGSCPRHIMSLTPSTIWIGVDHPINFGIGIHLGKEGECRENFTVEDSSKWAEGFGLRLENLRTGKSVTHWFKSTHPERKGIRSATCQASLHYDSILSTAALDLEANNGTVIKVEPVLSTSACPYLKGKNLKIEAKPKLYLVRKAMTQPEQIFRLMSESRIRFLQGDWVGGKELLWQALEKDPSFYPPRKALLYYIARKELDLLQGFRLLKSFLPFRTHENRGISDTDYWTYVYQFWFLTDMNLAELFFTPREVSGLPETRTTLEQPILTEPKGFQPVEKFHERWQKRKNRKKH